MKDGGLFPKGPFGGSGRQGEDPTEGKWVGDRGQSAQVKKFEGGSDYLFFQGPAPKTAVQDDLPSFFSGDNLKGTSISPLALPVAATGAAAAAGAAVAALRTADGERSPPSICCQKAKQNATFTFSRIA